ncbi:DUF1553 domain-containing protein [Planctomycetaceae bacterium SH139]
MQIQRYSLPCAPSWQLRFIRNSFLLSLVCLTTASTASAAEPVDFNADIRPLLSGSCFTCHGPDENTREAGLRLDTQAGATADMGGYAAIAPGSPEASELLNRLTTDDADLQMPPAGHGKRLSPAEIETIERWIHQGANYETHWSYLPPEKSPLPEVDNQAWSQHPIDRFVLARLKAAGLSPSARADRLTLARRVSLALTGLPPTPEQVATFVNDPRPAAYEIYVDSLLASPAYGERWARVWLDLARYADSAGYADDPERTIWAYRDYVIASLNANKPFDQFTIEQIAGDLLENPSEEQLVATAFHRNTMTNNEGGTNDEQFRNEAVIDRVNTTMAVWMGTTIACAQCHTHKYDPITQHEYFQFFDFFNQSPDADRRDESPRLELYSPEQRNQQTELKQAIANLQTELQQQTPALDAALDDWLTTLRTPPEWQTLLPAHAELLPMPSGDPEHSDAEPTGATHKLEISEAGDVQLVGERPQQAIYELSIPVTQAATATALQLEINPAQTTNFVLSRVSLRWEPSDEQPISGRYIRVELPGSGKFLHLAEVEVFSNGDNVAPAGKATQSSTGYSAPAARANDGDTNGDFTAGSVTHTNQEDSPWWEVDLGQAQPIDKISLWNRTDGGKQISDRLRGYHVQILDADRNVVWTSAEIKADTAELSPEPEIAHEVSGARPIVLAAANANYSQPSFPAEAVLQGLASNEKTAGNTGWAIGGKTGNSHQLVLSFQSPVELGEGQLVLRLEQVSVHTQHLLTHFRLALTNNQSVTRWAQLPTELRPLIGKSELVAAERDRLAQHFRGVTEMLAEPRAELKRLETELAAIKPHTSVPVMRELPADRRRTTRLQVRGNYQSLAEEATAGVPAAFHPLPADAPRNRLGLARWLISPQNPLTARVIVNRHWEQLFGTGLVETSEEFGSQGEPPSHPLLLDWLAVDLVDHGWDLKRLLKQSVMSATYCQSSHVTPDLLEADPDNRLFARGPRFRISAEMVRDQALHVADLLSPRLLGPPVRPPQPNLGLSAAFGSATDWKTSAGEDRYRRGIYTTWRRSNPYPSMATFDAPNREVCTLRRSRTNTPLQALVTLNDPVYVEAAQALARGAASLPELESRLTQIFSRALLRSPSSAETDLLLDLYQRVQQEYADHSEEARQLAEQPLGPLPADSDPVEMAALTVVANAVLNLDEMLMPR